MQFWSHQDSTLLILQSLSTSRYSHDLVTAKWRRYRAAKLSLLTNGPEEARRSARRRSPIKGVQAVKMTRWEKTRWLGRWDWCSSSMWTESKHPRLNVHHPVSLWFQVVGLVSPPSVTPTPHYVRTTVAAADGRAQDSCIVKARRGAWQGWNCTAIAASRPDNCYAAYGSPPTAIFCVALTTFHLAMRYSFATVLGV